MFFLLFNSFSLNKRNRSKIAWEKIITIDKGWIVIVNIEIRVKKIILKILIFFFISLIKSKKITIEISWINNAKFTTRISCEHQMRNKLNDVKNKTKLTKEFFKTYLEIKKTNIRHEVFKNIWKSLSEYTVCPK